MWCSAIGCIVMLILSLLVAPLAAEAQPPIESAPDRLSYAASPA